MTKWLDATSCDTDKWPELLQTYEEVFQPFASENLTLLELGVRTGGSLQLWRDYFENGQIVGLDLNEVEIPDPTGRIRVYRGSQDDLALLDRIRSNEAPGGFDIIIDDASHIGQLTRTSFWHLFRRHLKPGGLYCIEDWGTGYWSAWPDGRDYEWHADSPLREGWTPQVALSDAPREFRSHLHGVVGVVKELVDEAARSEITKGGPFGEPRCYGRIRQLRIQAGLVVVTKR